MNWRFLKALKLPCRPLFASIPGGELTEPMPPEMALGMRVPKYGFTQWKDIFLPRQLLAGGTFARIIREMHTSIGKAGYGQNWVDGIQACLGVTLRQVHQLHEHDLYLGVKGCGDQADVSPICIAHHLGFFGGKPTFASRQVFCWSAFIVSFECWRRCQTLFTLSPTPKVVRQSAKSSVSDSERYDVIITDPPYYDAIPYSDLMDFFYVWLKRIFSGTQVGNSFLEELSPKWNAEEADGELIDDSSRHGGDKNASKDSYESGMSDAFLVCRKSLTDSGKLVIVFANKNPTAWETLVSALIHAGFVVDSSWPIATEMRGGVRNYGRASLASSVWLVCKKRPAAARPGWDNRVLEEMQNNITGRLRDYWDAGIRGPDFVWAATGPALEAYSKHPIVKKANDPGQVMTVGEFLSSVRRMVVDFVVGQVLTGEKEESDMAAADRMDAPTAYYLLHRHDFGLDEAPAGACILYSTACGVADRDLEATWNLVSHKGSSTAADEDDVGADPDAEAEDDSEGESGSKIKLKTWAQRKNRAMGYEAPSGKPIPLIDRVHRLMHLWKAGDVHKVDEYLDDNGLRRQELFKRFVQSLIELSQAGSEERKLLESLSNHIQAKGMTPEQRQATLAFGDEKQ